MVESLKQKSEVNRLRDTDHKINDTTAGAVAEASVPVSSVISSAVNPSETSLLQMYRQTMELRDMDANAVSPLALAYLGDCLYDLAVREYVIQHYPGNINRMNKQKTMLVCAHAQSEIMGYFLGNNMLTEEEQNLYRRARNQKSETHSKNSSILEYHRATGFEALIGWLYIRKEYARMIELIGIGTRHLLEIAKKGNTES